MAQPVSGSRSTDADIELRVIGAIAKAMDKPAAEITPATSLEADLGAQSLDYLDIAFLIERDFRIQFPRANFIQRAADHFGEANLVRNGALTDFGLELLAAGMPELDRSRLRPGLRVDEVRKMFTVATFIRVVKQLLDHKATLDRACPSCGAHMEESSTLPEFACAACGTAVPLPPGDDVLFDHMLSLEKSARSTRRDA
jgi:acyl carrier protein